MEFLKESSLNLPLAQVRKGFAETRVLVRIVRPEALLLKNATDANTTSALTLILAWYR